MWFLHTVSAIIHREGADFVKIVSTTAECDRLIQEGKMENKKVVFDERECMSCDRHTGFFQRRTSWFPVQWTGGWSCDHCHERNRNFRFSEH
jgi:hypothetical protein